MRSARKHLAVLGVYTLLALALTWPLMLHFATHVPGDGGDDPALTWNLWWVKYALLDIHTNPFHCRYMFYPIGINLAFYTLTVLNGVLSIPLQLWLGLVPAGNLILLSSFVLGAFGAYLLAESILRTGGTAAVATGYGGSTTGPDAGGKEPTRTPSHPAAAVRPRNARTLAFLVAGCIYGFASCKLFYASLGQFNIASSQWIPFFVLFLLRMGRNPKRLRYPVLGGLFLTMQAWAEMTFASFLLIFTGLYALWLAAVKPRRQALTFLGGLLLMLALFAVGISPMLAAMLPDLRAEGDFWVRGTGFAEVFSADPVGLLLPTRLHPLFGKLVDRFPFPHDKGQHLYPGYVTLLLALLGLLKGKGRPRDIKLRAFFAAAALAFTVLALGPTLHLNGRDTGIALPFTLLQKLPFFKGNRYPGRYNVMVMLCLALLAAWGGEYIISRALGPSAGALRSGLVGSILVALILFEHLSVPLPLSDMRIPQAYRIIADDPAPGAVLEIPLAWRNGFRITGTMDVVIMFEQFYQTLHHRPILGGNTSRNPEFKFQYFTEAPVINSIIALENGHRLDDATLARDREVAPYVARFLNLRYLVIHRRETPPELVRYLEEVFGPLLEPVNARGQTADAGDILVYRFALPPLPEELTLDMNSPQGYLSRGEGWAPVSTGEYVWAQRRRVRLLATLDGGARRVRFRAFVPGEGQKLSLSVNGRKLPPMEMQPGWGEYELLLPPGVLRSGLNELTLGFSRLFPAAPCRWPERPGNLGRPLADGASALPTRCLSLLVRSAGMDVGDFAHIYANGVELSPNERGYNFVVLNPDTGEVEARASFDTFASEEESRAMAGFVAGIPSGRIVAVAVRDEASLHLTEAGVGALRLIGAASDLRGCFRCGHAIIGVKGLRPGEAMEGVSPTLPVSLWAGEALSEPHVAAAFEWVRLGD